MNTPTYPHFVSSDETYIDYEISHELPSFDTPDSVANEHSIVVRFSYDTKEKSADGLVVYEQNGNHEELGNLTLTSEQFYRITGCPIRAEDILTTLRSVEGSITVKDGVATLPDGTQITL